MLKLDAAQTAALLTELSRRTALAGGPPYRARADARAAESVSALATPLETVIAQGRLREIPGVGQTIADIITKLHHTGMHPTLEKLRREYPAFEPAPAMIRSSKMSTAAKAWWRC